MFCVKQAMKILRMTDLALSGKRVFIRSDLNVPQDESGRITEDTRIRASLTAIRVALERGARVMVTSHLGRPVEGNFRPIDSLEPVAARISELLDRSVPLIRDWVGTVEVAPSPGQVVLLENCRLNIGEKANDEELSRRMASLCDVYVNDAFATAHRAEATTEGMAVHAPIACAGPLMAAEIDALTLALDNPARPMVAIVGGSKVSTKLTILETLAEKVDHLIIGGGIANTFMAAAGLPTGRSLIERDLVDVAAGIMEAAKSRGVSVPVPVDVVVAKELSATAESTVKASTDIADDDMVLDIGPRTTASLVKSLLGAGTIIWNGPVGVFELDQFGEGTKALSNAIAMSEAYTLAGGGDTIAAIAKYGVRDRLSYISTAGGAFLEFLEGRKLPALVILEARTRSR